MILKKYHIDAFTNSLFGGNPACVIPLKQWLDDDLLMKITRENNLAETAFFVETSRGFHIRWFTPEIEMDLCGHATLASAHVIHKYLYPDRECIRFESASGELMVKCEGGRYLLDFPSRMPVHAELPMIISESLNVQPKEVWLSRDYVLVYESEEEILQLQPDESRLKEIDLGHGGIVCTAPGLDTDFVSRFFTPGAKIFEDPVTGSAHCSLIPFWSERLKRSEMRALQLSDRKGELYCTNGKNRVLIAGNAITYSIGEIYLHE